LSTKYYTGNQRSSNMNPAKKNLQVNSGTLEGQAVLAQLMAPVVNDKNMIRDGNLVGQIQIT